MVVMSDAMDGAGPSQGLQHASFTQRKLEKFYLATYMFFLGSKDWLQVIQQILVWNKPLASAALYIAVHWLFVILAQTHLSLMTLIGKLILLFIFLDILRRAATKKSEATAMTSSSTRATISKNQPPKPVPFENALLRNFTPLKAEEFPAYEVMCLWLAKGLMWLENFYIALRYWSIQEPYLFFVCVLTPGIFLSLLGKYVTTIVVAYVLVMGLLALPYVEYHDLRVKVFIFVQVHYPQALTQVYSYWDNLKSFVSKDSTDFHEVSLHSYGDERSTAQALQDAFEQATSLTNGRRASEEILHVTSNESQIPLSGSSLGMDELAVNPGLSILQDSALGMHSQAFHGVDDSLSFGSLSLGEGDFPSVNGLDQSISLPHFPSEFRPPNRGNFGEHSTMNLINEEEEISLPSSCNNRDLDPFADSVDIGFAGHYRPDGGPQTYNNRDLDPYADLVNIGFVGHSRPDGEPQTYNNRDPDPYADSVDIGFVGQNSPGGGLQTYNNPDLDPYADLVDIEFVGHNRRDGGPQTYSDASSPETYNRFQQPVTNSSNLQPCLSPSYLDLIAGDSACQEGLYAAGEFVPPPTYQAATEGYDDAIYSGSMDEVGTPLHTASSSTTTTSSSRSSSSTQSSEALGGTEKGGYYLRHR